MSLLRRRRHGRSEPSFYRPYVISGVMILGLTLITYFAFKPGNPFADKYRIDAVFKTSNGLRKGSPVRIAGMDVGKVVRLGRGPGHTTRVTMELREDGRPVHRDAVARIRPRLFLEGGFMVALSPGSPSAPELPEGGTIPLASTATPVQLNQVLGMFDAPARRSLTVTLDTFAKGLDKGGAEGLKQLAPQLAPVLRESAWVTQAAQGTQVHDLSRLVQATDRITTALDRNPDRLEDLVGHVADTARALHERDDELAASIRGTRRVLAAAPDALEGVEDVLPITERSVTRLRPALASAPRAFRRTTKVLQDLGGLVAPERRANTIAALETAFRDLPTAVVRLAELFPTVKPLTDCLSSHIVPVLESEVPDGELATGRPAWQDFVHGLTGLAGAAQNFDGNGYALRYQFGLDGSTISLANIPVVGQLVARGPSNLRSRPLPRDDRKPPTQHPNKVCSEQPVPSLETPSGSAGFQVIPSDPGAPAKVTLPAIERALQRGALRKSLKAAGR